MERNNTKGLLFGALSAAAYGVNPVALFLYQDGYSTTTVLMYRYLFAVLFMAILMYLKKESFLSTKAELVKMFFMGMLFSFSSLTLFESYNHIDVSIASTLLFSYPAFVAIIMAIMFKERLSKLQLFGIVMVAIGICLLNIQPSNSASHSLSDSLIGVGLVTLSSLLYAVYIVATQQDKTLSKISSLKLSFYAILFGSLVYIIPSIFNADDNAPIMLTNATHWTCVISLALFPTLISVTLLAYSIRYIGPTVSAILGAFEPITAVLLGMVLFGERPSILAFISMFIIIIGISMVILKKQRAESNAD
ncbi:MAG: EamA family transporter [Bacteroidia bacterium]|nr:EamA family transporter [Bacteroidia bacterium]